MEKTDIGRKIMIDYIRSKELFLKIYPDENLQNQVENYIKNHEKKVIRNLKFCHNNRWEVHLKKDAFFKLCLVYAFLPVVKTRYEEKGISDEIFYDTMNDIKIWINDCRDNLHKTGLDELNWIMHHMNLNIFKIGRLQYQKFFYFWKSSYNKNGENIKFGDKIWNVHIPRGEKLDYVACEKSFEMAQEFIRKYFPEYPDNKFMCHSWLLYSRNHEFMPENSNILKFPQLFDVIADREDPASSYRWLFSVRYKNSVMLKNKKKKGSYGLTENLPQNTIMQKQAIEYIKNGGTLGDGFGVKII